MSKRKFPEIFSRASRTKDASPRRLNITSHDRAPIREKVQGARSELPPGPIYCSSSWENFIYYICPTFLPRAPRAGIYGTHLRHHDDARFVRENEVVRRAEVGGRDRAGLHRHAALGVLHRDLEVVVPARLEPPLQDHVRLADRVEPGARQRLDLDGGGGGVTLKKKGSFTVGNLRCKQ